MIERSAAMTSDDGFKPFLWLAATVAAVVALLAPTFFSMAQIWNRDSTFTHGYIIPLLSAWLLWRDRVGLASVRVQPEPRAFAAIAALLATWLAGDFAGVQVIRQAAAVALTIASVWAVLGTAFARRALFPLAYLFFAVPFGDFMVPYLIEFTTRFTVAAVEAVGVPIYREGTNFSLPSGNFEVVKACSGVRYLIATVALGVLFCALSYATWRRRVAFMALCLALPILANGLRAFGIVMIAHYSELRYAVGVDHLIYGWVFFGVVIALLFWIGSKFADASEPHAHPQSAREPQRFSRAALGAVCLTLAGVVGANQLWRATAASQTIELPRFVAGAARWNGPSTAGVVWTPEYAKSDAAASARYGSAQGDVIVHARTFARISAQQNEAMTAPLLPEPTAEFHLDDRGVFVADNGPLVSAAVITDSNGLRWLVWRWHYADGTLVQSGRDAKLREFAAWLRHRRPTGAVVCAATKLSGPNAEARAARLLKEFLSAHAWRVLARTE